MKSNPKAPNDDVREIRRVKLVRKKLLVACAVLALVLSGVVVLIWKVPLDRQAVTARAESSTGAWVEMGGFRRQWLPPGFTAERVRLSDSNGNVLTIAAITVGASYVGLIHRPVSITRVYASGLHLTTTGQRHTFLNGGNLKENFTVDDLLLQNARIDLHSESGREAPLTFLVQELRLEHLGEGKRTAFHTALHNPRPSGEIRSDGYFGPLNPKDVGQTPLSGDFTFANADLSVPRAISGILGARGHLNGKLSAIECNGTADVPSFHVFGSSHAVHIAAQFNSVVDATTGNVFLRQVISHFRGTTVSATGRVLPTADRPGKTVVLDLTVHKGRVEDVLLLFSRRSVPSMEGSLDLAGTVTIPPDPPGFLERLKLDGGFEIAGGRFTNPEVQTGIDRLSASAAGESKREEKQNPIVVAGDIRASVADRRGIASLRNVIFEAPGVRVDLGGTFTLRNRAIDMNGTLRTSGKLSDGASGMKAITLKLLSPLWPRRASVTSVPLHIGGNASHPKLRFRLRGPNS